MGQTRQSNPAGPLPPPFCQGCVTGDMSPWGIQTCRFQLKATKTSPLYNKRSLVMSCWGVVGGPSEARA